MSVKAGVSSLKVVISSLSVVVGSILSVTDSVDSVVSLVTPSTTYGSVVVSSSISDSVEVVSSNDVVSFSVVVVVSREIDAYFNLSLVLDVSSSLFAVAESLDIEEYSSLFLF